MRVSKTIKVAVYSCKVIVVLTDDVDKEGARICKKHKMPVADGENYALAISTTDVHTYYVIYNPKSININRLVHEVTHIGGMILKDRGTEESLDGENLAYLNGFLAEEIYKFVIKNHIAL
jgi:hypothetical protein